MTSVDGLLAFAARARVAPGFGCLLTSSAIDLVPRGVSRGQVQTRSGDRP